jgi:predicted RNA methylase/putative lipoic acid-binding regulatory protein
MLAPQIRHNHSKLGFYPTDGKTIEVISKSIDFNGSVTMLDPCCGDGVALKAIDALGGNDNYTIGVELDHNRYLHAKNMLNTCLHSDALMQAKYTQHQLDFLFLNPPYGESLGEKRLEYRFVKSYSQSLRVNGVIALIIPFTIVNEEFLNYLLSNFITVSSGLSPEQKFKQWIFIGKKKKRSNPLKQDITDVLQTTKMDFEPKKVVCKASTKSKFKITTSNITAEQIDGVISQSSTLWDGYFDNYFVQNKIPIKQPLIKLTDWFVAMGILGGHISGVLENEKSKVLIKGKVYKQYGKPMNHDEDGGYVKTEEFVAKILAINIDTKSEEYGEIYEIK